MQRFTLALILALSACGRASISNRNVGEEGIDNSVDTVDLEVEPTDQGTLDLVNGAPINLAYGKPVIQSSTAWGGVGSRAVDGNTDGNYWAGSVTHTNYENQPYLIVDLGQDMVVTEVELYNRTDCCKERLSNYYVSLSTTAGHPYVSAWREDKRGAAGNKDSFKTGGVSARYVGIRLNGPGILSLAEVRVLGNAPAKGKRILTHADKCVDVTGMSQSATYVQQWSCWGGANQRFNFEHLAGDYYRIRAIHSGKCLSIPNSRTDRIYLEHTDCANVSHQFFKLADRAGDKFAIKPLHSNKCIEVPSSAEHNGVALHQASCDGGKNQRFRIVD